MEKKPFKSPSVVEVALYPTLEVNGKVENPTSLVNHERRIEEEAIEPTFPAEPMYEKPCARDGR